MATVYSQLAALLRGGVPMLKSLAVLREQSSNKNLKGDSRRGLSPRRRRLDAGATRWPASRGPSTKWPSTWSAPAAKAAFWKTPSTASPRSPSSRKTSRAARSAPWSIRCFSAPPAPWSSPCLIVFFVPKFAVMFERLRERGELPWATEMLLWISESARSPIVLFIADSQRHRPRSLSSICRLQTPEGRRTADYVRIKVPMAGPIFLSFAVARFCRVLGTLLHNGVPILKALEISREAAGNKILTEAIAKASENISSGQSLAGPLASSGHFPKMVVEMIAVAEESNTLDTVLVGLADDLEKRTSRQLDLFVRLLEPIMLIVLAAIVLVVVIALFVPVIKMSSTMG